MNLNRRTFLKIAGIGSISVTAACTAESEKTLYSLVQAPEDMVTGRAAWYATTCRECPAGCGMFAKNREGRVIKVEGNPLHPINRGTLCMRGQAALQGVYDPDRIRAPLLKGKNGWEPISYPEAEAILKAKATEASRKGPDRVKSMTEVVGESLFGLLSEALGKWRSQPPLVFETYAYEALKAANHAVFGINGLPGYHMDEADLLISLGADFLETWLSPVEYARKFKQMHAVDGTRKNRFIQISPYQSLTGANADRWIACRPDAEAVVALGCLRQALARGRGASLDRTLREAVRKVAAPYSKDRVLELAGIPADDYDALLSHLLKAQKPLIVGTGSGAVGSQSLQANIAANLLNQVLDPDLSRLDFEQRHRAEIAATRAEILAFFEALEAEDTDLLLLNNVNPVYAMASHAGIAEVLRKPAPFVACFTSFMDDTATLADLIFPVRLPLESWDEYGGKQGICSTLQPAMGALTQASTLGDVMLRLAFDDKQAPDTYKAYLFKNLKDRGKIHGTTEWVQALQRGGRFERSEKSPVPEATDRFSTFFQNTITPLTSKSPLMAVPSVRFFDGRGANRPWLAEIPDPITKVAWQTPVLMHPDTLKQRAIKHEETVRIESVYGMMEARVYEYEGILPGIMAMGVGQGHEAMGRFAQGVGVNPFRLLPPGVDSASGGPLFLADPVSITSIPSTGPLASTSGSRIQHGRKIALSVPLKALAGDPEKERTGLGMNAFPLTLPLPEGYDRKRDFYPPHDHTDYRWSMVVDLDRCIGCAACSAACYAENNLGIVGEQRIIEGREMAWMSVERYHSPEQMEKITFLPMLCQHCDNAPCESVCPVFAPHHSKEGINNQIYNRCIGTRFCSQNCPYKVRRFNWFAWKWPDPLPLQLNPDVTVRSKGVMEKCSFCIQRIKEVRTTAKNEKRNLRDGEVTPACVQTCPTGALIFGNLMDKESRVRKRVDDPRTYQIMGYLNTKPAVFYLKKVVQELF